jgi:hypothetical protein
LAIPKSAYFPYIDSAEVDLSDRAELEAVMAEKKKYTLSEWINTFGEYKITNVRYLQRCCSNSKVSVGDNEEFECRLPRGFRADQEPYGKKGNRYRWVIIDERTAEEKKHKLDIFKPPPVITRSDQLLLAEKREKIVLEYIKKGKDFKFSELGNKIGLTESGAFYLYHRVLKELAPLTAGEIEVKLGLSKKDAIKVQQEIMEVLAALKKKRKKASSRAV